mmetsp:Transcript_118748/g.253441  ORF Transcript_118748/g.253441 Transcript_118748/m.253441 type:complete len:152 (+) Transcript_118748:59-514(+)
MAAEDLLGFTDAGPMVAAPEDPFMGMSAPATEANEFMPEITALREWEDRHEQALEERSLREEAEKKERRKAAEDELKKWHQERTAGIEQSRSSTAAVEQLRGEEIKGVANPWERVCELINTSARTTDESRDTSRMAALLIQLKTSPVAAAA